MIKIWQKIKDILDVKKNFINENKNLFDGKKNFIKGNFVKIVKKKLQGDKFIKLKI